MILNKLRELFTGSCTGWFESAFEVDWEMSCWAHDIIYSAHGGAFLKIKSDIDLMLDVWAVAVVADKWWQRLIIRANSIAMFLAVATIGWGIWLYKSIK